MREKDLEKVFDDALEGKIPGVTVVQPTARPECCTRASKGEPIGDCKCSVMCMCSCCDCDLN